MPYPMIWQLLQDIGVWLYVIDKLDGSWNPTAILHLHIDQGQGRSVQLRFLLRMLSYSASIAAKADNMKYEARFGSSLLLFVDRFVYSPFYS